MQNWSEDEKRKFSQDNLFSERVERLRHSGLWAEMAPWEQQFMAALPMETDRQAIVDASWLVESAVCLAWALKLVDTIPAYDEECDHDFLKRVPEDLAHVENSVLRSQHQIERTRETAELWHWRSRTYTLVAEGRIPAILPAGNTIDEELRSLSARCAAEGVLPPPIGGDFPALGKAYRELLPGEYNMIGSIAQERHKALNWLCGYAPGNRWSDTPTET
jgi:hypothetical protein